MTYVLDTSAILASLWSEPGGKRVASELGSALVSTVNLTELVSKLQDRGATAEQAVAVVANLAMERVPFDEDQAIRAGALRSSSRTLGLSLGDRCCLALALAKGLPALTTDRAWAELDVGVKIEVIR